MKKSILFLVGLCIISLAYAQQKEFGIDLRKSSIKWEGSDLLGMNKHYGTVKFKKGSISLDDNLIKINSIVGGEFEIDMNSIVNEDAEGEYNEMLVSHLKNEDFFNVKKYPIAKLEILSVKQIGTANLDVIAYLTINEVRQIVKYRSSYENTNEQITMKSKLVIDRTLWGINYKSKMLFEYVKDGLIADDISFEVLVVASLKQENGC